jgi:hypothetical protein
MSHNILVKQPKSYSYYNGGLAWQIDLPKALTQELISSSEVVARYKTGRISATARLGARSEDRLEVRPDVRSDGRPEIRSDARVDGAPSRPLPNLRTQNKELIVLQLPAKLKGKTVSAGIVVEEVMMQHYGLDLRDPSVSHWLERNAPDVKYAIAVSRLNSLKGTGKLKFKVATNGTVQVQVPSEVDRRLREVASRCRQTKPDPNLVEWFHGWVGRLFSIGRSRLV